MGAYKQLVSSGSDGRKLLDDDHRIDEPLVVDSITNPANLLPLDEIPIDIHLEDDVAFPRHPTGSAFESDAPPAYGSDVSLSGLSRSVPYPERKGTPVGSYPLNLPSALWESGVLFNPNSPALYDLCLERDPASPFESTVAQPAGDVSSASIPTPQVPTLNDFAAAKPHPEAMFNPELLEWRLVVDHFSICKKPLEDDEVVQADGIFEACNLRPGSIRIYETVPISLPSDQQLHPIRRNFPRLRHAAAAKEEEGLQEGEVLEDFNSHKCWITGCRILSSPPDTITAVLDRQLLMHFRENRRSNPAVGLTAQETFVRALRVLLRIIGNAAHGESRHIVTQGSTITQKLGYDDIVREIFAQLGWPVDLLPSDGREAIKPCGLFDGTDESRRLLRIWIELQAWLQHETDLLRQESPRSSLLSQPDPAGAVLTKVRMQSAIPRLLDLIGFSEDQIDPIYSGRPVTALTRQAFEFLGLSASSRDELVKFAYLMKLEVGPSQASVLLSCVETIQTSQRIDSQILKELIAYEKSRGRFTMRDVDKAYEQLHLTERQLGSGVVRDQIPHDFIIDSYQARLRDAFSRGDSTEYYGVKEALKLVALFLGNPATLQEAQNAKVDMDIDQAYSLLEVGKDFDDSTVLAVYDIRITDAPGKAEMLRDALTCVAEDRNSGYLRDFITTGQKSSAADAEEAWQQMPSEDRPAGINNIGNTCYLNSVLQYFFTIREIRDRVFQLAAAAGNAGSQGQSSAAAEGADADVSRRVGGRKVSAREIARSKRFVLHLAELFHQLIHTVDLAVTPKRELAYLALVSSRVEEDETSAEGSVPAPPSTTEAGQQILTDEPVSISPVLDRGTLPSVVEESMDQSETLSRAPPAGTAAADPAVELPAAVSSNEVDAADVPLPPSRAVTLDSRKPTLAPPLPPRPRRATTAITKQPIPPGTDKDPPPARQNSLMQLGAQQDVSECLDNCMFQLEIALATQGGADTSQPYKAESPVDARMDLDDSESSGLSLGPGNEDLLSKLFLGKTCQQLELVEHDSAKGPSIHTKKEIFKILPVDVLEEGRDLYDGLDGFFDEETLNNSEGKPLRRTVTLVDPPPLLQIQLQRVQYDRQTMRAFKSQAHMAMDETLYMDRYLDFDPADAEDQKRLEKRKRSREARRKIAALRTRLADLKPSEKPVSQTLLQTEQVLKGLGTLAPLDDLKRLVTERPRSASASSTSSNATARPQEIGTDGSQPSTRPTKTDDAKPLASLIDADLLDFLHSESDQVTSEVKEAERAIAALKQEMTEIWADEKRVEYSLAAVFMHRGEASHGHYFLNQRKLTPGVEETGASKWFKYNDSAVSSVKANEVLRDTSGATPYLVTYVRKDLQDQIGLVDTVRREMGLSPSQNGEVTGATKGKADEARDQGERDVSTPTASKKARLSPPPPLDVADAEVEAEAALAESQADTTAAVARMDVS